MRYHMTPVADPPQPDGSASRPRGPSSFRIFLPLLMLAVSRVSRISGQTRGAKIALRGVSGCWNRSARLSISQAFSPRHP